MKQQQFLLIINPVKDKMFRLALRLLISKESAEDATQEIILKLWNRKHKINHYANIEAFAMKMVKNHCLDELKAKRSSNLKIIHQNYESNQIPLQREIELNNEMEWIGRIIEELPEQQKVIFQLRDMEQYEYEEISKILEMKETAIRVALSRARKTVREKLTETHSYGTR